MTSHVRPGATQTLTLQLPPAAAWAARPGLLAAGGNLQQLSGSVRAAQQRCSGMPHCAGITFELVVGASCADALAPAAAISSDKIYLKSSSAGGGGAGWCSLLRPAALQGVHLENVEALLSTDSVLLQGKGEVGEGEGDAAVVESA